MMTRTKTQIVFIIMLFTLFLLAVSFTPTPTVNIAYAAEHDLSGFGDDDQDLADGSANEEEQEFFAGDQTVPTGVVPGDFGEISTTPGGGGTEVNSTPNAGGQPTPAAESSYTPLAPLPGIEAGSDVSLPNYIESLFRIGLGLAGVFAVLMLVVAGIQYIGSAGNEGLKGAAKSRITNVFFGLIIGASVFIIFNTINPDLLKTGISIETVTVELSTGESGSVGSRTFEETRVAGKWYFTQYSTNTRNTVTEDKGPYNTVAACEDARQNIQFPESYDTNACIQAQTQSAPVIPEQQQTISEKYYFYTWDSTNGNSKQDGPYNSKGSCESSRSNVQEPWRTQPCGLR